MFFDLNVPVPLPPSSTTFSSKKDKGKSKQLSAPAPGPAKVSWTQSQLATIEAKIELLVHLGYSVIALVQTVNKRVESKAHINVLDELIKILKPREGIVYLKRLNVILDGDSEKGFGFTNMNQPLLSTYDILSLTPTTQATLALACLTHSQPSPLTAHIICIPLTLPRLPFFLKHTLVRTAVRNGTAFEICYAGALGVEHDVVLVDSGAVGDGQAMKRNWWASARELCRVTGGKGVVVSSGSASEDGFRSPKDVANVIGLLGLPQNVTHDTVSTNPKSLVIRAQSRKTYRSVLSEPELVIPAGYMVQDAPAVAAEAHKKRPREESDDEEEAGMSPSKSSSAGKEGDTNGGQGSSGNGKRKKKKQKNKDGGGRS